MMRKIVFSLLICASVGFFAASCVRDRGNHDYEPELEIKDFVIHPFNDVGLYDTTVYLFENFTIDPTQFAEPLFDGDTEGCTFRWFLLPGLNEGAGMSKDMVITISKQASPKLDLFLLPPTAKQDDYSDIPFDSYPGMEGDPYPLIKAGTYLLYFEISRDGMTEVVRKPLKVDILPGEAKMSLQWFILKDNNGTTDFDFYDPLKEESERLQSNVFATMYNEGALKLPPTFSYPEGRPMELPAGKPVSIVYSPLFLLDFQKIDSEQRQKKYWSKVPMRLGGKEAIDGAEEDGGGCQGVIFVVSEDDFYTVDILNRKLIAGTPDMFPDDPYENPRKFLHFTGTQLNNQYNPVSTGNMMYGFWATMETPGATPEETTVDMRVFSLYKGMGGTVCRFWGPALQSESQPLNHLHKDFVRGYFNGSIVFDMKSNTFLYSADAATRTEYKAFIKNDDTDWANGTTPPDNMPDLIDMEYDLKALINDGWCKVDPAANQFAALMVYDGDDAAREGEHMLLIPATGTPEVNGKTGNYGGMMPVYPFARKHIVPKREGALNILRDDAMLHLNGGTMADIWVAVDNKFYKYIPVERTEESYENEPNFVREELKLQLPATEKIAYFYQYSPTGSELDIHKVVLSNDEAANEWHVRVFYAGETDGSEMKQPEPNLLNADTGSRAEPDGELLLEHFWGTGKAAKCIYTSNKPAISFYN